MHATVERAAPLAGMRTELCRGGRGGAAADDGGAAAVVARQQKPAGREARNGPGRAEGGAGGRFGHSRCACLRVCRFFTSRTGSTTCTQPPRSRRGPKTASRHYLAVAPGQPARSPRWKAKAAAGLRRPARAASSRCRWSSPRRGWRRRGAAGPCTPRRLARHGVGRCHPTALRPCRRAEPARRRPQPPPRRGGCGARPTRARVHGVHLRSPNASVTLRNIR